MCICSDRLRGRKILSFVFCLVEFKKIVGWNITERGANLFYHVLCLVFSCIFTSVWAECVINCDCNIWGCHICDSLLFIIQSCRIFWTFEWEKNISAFQTTCQEWRTEKLYFCGISFRFWRFFEKFADFHNFSRIRNQNEYRIFKNGLMCDEFVKTTENFPICTNFMKIIVTLQRFLIEKPFSITLFIKKSVFQHLLCPKKRIQHLNKRI